MSDLDARPHAIAPEDSAERVSPTALSRPAPQVPPAERARAWLDWYGPGRLAVTVCCVALVAVGGFWLVRAPAPSAEATLPRASAPSVPGAPPGVTLPVTSSPGDAASTSAPAAPSTAPVTTVGLTHVVVHVAGEVSEPGVYELAAGARVDDAVRQAGGPTAEADLDAVNLAEFLGDGQRLFVPPVGVADHATTPVLSPPSASGSSSGSSGSSDSAGAPVGPIDVNRADIDELEELPGVGPATARAIVDDREANGPFLSVDDLERVAGVGPAKLAALRDLVTV